MSEDVPLDGRTGPAPPEARSGTPARVPQDAPLLNDVMPWSVPPLRLGRGWVRAPGPATLRSRWAVLTGTEDAADRAALFGPSRARTLRSAVAPIPGHAAPGSRLGRERGACPEPVRILHGPYDQQWLIPDSRLIDAARAELWRVTDGSRQVHLVETSAPTGRAAAQHGGPALTFSTLVPDGHSPAGRPGRIRPLHRRPGGQEPNLAPGLLEHLSHRLGQAVGAEDFLAWTAVAACTGAGDGRIRVPLTADPGLWEEGVALGRRSLWLHTRGTHHFPGPDSGRPRMPGGRRPYVRAAVPARPRSLSYDEEEQALHLGEGRIAPVAPGAWQYEAGGTGVLEAWFAQRTEEAGDGPQPGTLAAVRPGDWPQEWTSELLELITVLTLLAELRPGQQELERRLSSLPAIGTAELRGADVLPPPAAARRPASVLDLDEEGPDGQLALL